MKTTYHGTNEEKAEVASWIKSAKRNNPDEIKKNTACIICGRHSRIKENGVWYCEKHFK
jgi:hypothetical protein